MFQVVTKDSSFSVLYNGEAVLGSGKLSFKDRKGTDILPQLVSQESEAGRDVLRFEDESTRLSAALTIRCDDQTLVLHLQAQVNYDVFKKPITFASLGSAAVSFQPTEQPGAFMSSFRDYHWWTKPHFGTRWEEVRQNTRSLAWKINSNYVHLLTVSSGHYITQAEGTPEGLRIALSTHTDGHASCDATFLVLSVGEKPFVLPDINAEKGLEAVGNPGGARSRRDYPAALEELGWCTWDAFYREVTAEGVLGKAAELAQAELPVRWIMIDDGWSEVEELKLRSLGTDSAKFPDGLGGLVRQLKEQYGTRHVGVWHAFTGYWNGIHPKLAEELEPEGQASATRNGLFAPLQQAVCPICL